MENNKYIIYIRNYVELNTPVEFDFDYQKYEECKNELESHDISYNTKEIISTAYGLFYTAINFHKLASTTENNQSYYILIGDYISSYITELLYTNKMVKLLKTFAKNAKIILLNYLNNSHEDNLLEQLMSSLN